MVDKMERYKNFWENPSRYVLAPITQFLEGWRDLCYGEAQYAPCFKDGVQYIPLLDMIADIAVEVQQKMIEAGVEILDSLPEEAAKDRIHLFWTDRMHEFVLVKGGQLDQQKYYIYQQDIGGFPSLHYLTQDLYKLIVTNMKEAGAEIWDAIPDDKD